MRMDTLEAFQELLTIKLLIVECLRSKYCFFWECMIIICFVNKYYEKVMENSFKDVNL